MKPLFFDAAWNYIEYPGREVEGVAGNGVKENTIPAKTVEHAGQQKKGWFGFGR